MCVQFRGTRDGGLLLVGLTASAAFHSQLKKALAKLGPCPLITSFSASKS